jgi:CRP/FNR family cyclic AMP-dependent transcriptional regulator
VAGSDVGHLLESLGAVATVDEYVPGDHIFRQGEPCGDVRYMRAGGVKLTVTSRSGQQRVVGLIRPGEFFGEGCLAGQPVRVASAVAFLPSTVVRVEKHTILDALRKHPPMSDRFIAHVLARNIRIQEDLIDQLMNSAEKRLARTLVLLAERDAGGRPGDCVPMPSQEALSQMVGTTRSRVNVFLQRFKKLGYVTYQDPLWLTIHPSLHEMLERDDF